MGFGSLALASTVRSAAGRAKCRLQYSLKAPPGLSAPAIAGLTPYTATNAPGIYGSLSAIFVSAGPLVNGVPYAWSLRALARNIWYPTGPWRQPERSGRREADVRAPGIWLAVPPERPLATLELADVRPNPMFGTAWVSFSLTKPGPVTLEILDVQGRRIRTLAHGPRDAGPQRIGWDGRTDAGRTASAGVYLVRMEAEGRSLCRKVVCVR